MRVIIVGAGIAGLTLAWWLERDGWDVLVVERAPEFRAGGYMIDFYGPGHEVADRMGLLPKLEQHRAPISSVTAVNRHGRPTGEIDTSTYETMAGGMISLLRGDLARELREDVRSPVRFGTTVDAIEYPDGGVRVRLTDGSVEHADLLVGADGVHSRVRELVFGPEQRFVRFLGYHTAAFSLDDAELSGEVGARYQLLTVPNRMVGCYAARDNALASLLLYRTDGWELPADPVAALRDRFGDLGWVTRELLSVMPPDLYFDQVSQVEMDSWHRGPVVLVGDACGAVSLFAGHGASLAITGAYVLAQELAADQTEAVARYEARMRPVVLRTQSFGRGFIEWLAPSNRWRIHVRDWLMRLSRLPVVRTLLRNSVTPVTGDVLTRPRPHVGAR